VKGFTLIFTLTLLLFSNLTFGLEVEGDGRFYSRDDDTLSFIKKQLLSSAFRDVFTKEMKEMGLDSDKFWRNYEEKFQEYFTPIKESIEKKYGIDTGEANNAQKRDFQKALRLKRLGLKSRYGRLNRAIPQYSVKKMTRSSQVPNSRYLRLKAKVSRKELHRIYLQFTSTNPERHFSTLYLTANFNLIDTSWLETGVEIKSDFTDVILNHWREKLLENLKGKIDRVIFTDEVLEQELREFSRLSEGARVAMGGNGESSPGSLPEKSDFASSLWLKLSFNIKKVRENAETKKRKFSTIGDLLVLDLSQQSILLHSDFDGGDLLVSFEDPKALSTALANNIYQMPKEDLKKIEKVILNAKTDLKKVVLEIVDYENLGDITSLIKILGNRGITKQFSPMIKSFGPKNAKILLEYAGADEEMTNILRSLENTSIGADKVLKFSQPDQVFQLSLIKVGKGPKSEDHIEEKPTSPDSQEVGNKVKTKKSAS